MKKIQIAKDVAIIVKIDVRRYVFLLKEIWSVIKMKSTIGIYFEDNKFEICKEEELEEKSNQVMLIDVRYEDTVKDMTMSIWKAVNSIFD